MVLIAITLLVALAAALVTFAVALRLTRVVPTSSATKAAETGPEVRQRFGLESLFRSGPDARATIVARLPWALVVILIGGLITVLLLVMIHTNTGLARSDHSVNSFGANHATSLSTHVLKVMTQLGGAVVLVPLAIVIGIVETVRLRSRSVLPFLIVVVGGQFLVANLIKSVVHRARPTLDQLSGFSGSSFPSGHATASAACLAGFAIVMSRRRGTRARLILSSIAVGLAVAIGLTRVWLGVHWLTDVLAGLTLGWAWFALIAIAFGGHWMPSGAPLEGSRHDFARLRRKSGQS